VANEFFDALPFHRVIGRADGIEEIYLGRADGFFEQTAAPEAELASFLARYPVFLAEGQASEATCAAAGPVDAISRLVRQGCLLVFDYGYHQADIAAGRFPGGSMLGYRRRLATGDVFTALGGTDITHHVNFDHLSALLADRAWRKDGETEQYRFLCNAGILETLSALPQAERMAAKWLIHPEGLGGTISVLGFSKGIDSRLPGFGVVEGIQ
jgi:SAM-dependent MidA family methyltransferase